MKFIHKKSGLVLVTLLLSLLVYGVYSWPIPLMVADGIPSAGHKNPNAEVREMIFGDHLQILYHFFMAGEFVSGEVPFFHNVYELNRGDDADRQSLRAFYMPISLIFLVFQRLGGMAFGWNVTSFITVWLSFLFTVLLLRRWVGSHGIALGCGLVSILIPYRYVALFGGSPEGFAIMFLPMLYFFSDRLFAYGKIWDGVLAGLMILFIGFVDMHVFYFGVLAWPFWVLCGILLRGKGIGLGFIKKKWYAFMCFGLLALSGAGYMLFIAWRVKQSSLSAASRTTEELRLYSLVWQNLVNWEGSKAYIGFTMCLFILLGGGLYFWKFIRTRGQLRYVLAFSIMALMLFAGIGISLGTNFPLIPVKPVDIARVLVPKFEMIRQPTKVMCLFPYLMAVLLALTLKGVPSASLRRGLGMVLAIGLAVEYPRQVDAAICLLDSEHEAFAALIDDATEREVETRVLMLPIWPDNDAHTSVYQYYAGLYRLRMVNGYSFFGKDFNQAVYERLKGMNQAWLVQDQITGLEEMGVNYVAFFSHPFPSKVSPMPGSFVLDALIQDPRYTLISSYHAVSVFRIEHGVEAQPQPLQAEYLFPTRRFQAEYKMEHLKMLDITVKDEDMFGGRYLPLHEKGTNRFDSVLLSVAPHTEGTWALRVRGDGELAYEVFVENERLYEETVVVTDTQQWQWVEFTVPQQKDLYHTRFSASRIQGKVDVDVYTFQLGRSLTLSHGEEVRFPASYFLHSGELEPGKDWVYLRKRSTPFGKVFQGLGYRIEKGVYEVEVAYESEATEGAHLFNVYSSSNHKLTAHLEVKQGSRAHFGFKVENDFPVDLALHYPRMEDVVIKSITIKRL